MLRHAQPSTNPIDGAGRPVASIQILPILALVSLCASTAQGAVVSGEVSIPLSDSGYRPVISAWQAPKVRVAGTDLQTDVVVTGQYTGTFTLTDVPEGPVTLIYVETPGEDAFTMASRRLDVLVDGDVAGLAFRLQHHWKNLPGYPPPWRDPDYDIWEPYFVSARIGFILFRQRGVSPMSTELWRTTNGGNGWKLIGEWVDGVDPVKPDMTDRSMLFAGANTGVLTARSTAPFGVLRTADGGTTWTVVDLPSRPEANGIALVQNYARIDANRWIACGSENTGTYYGVGTPFAFTIWETADAGASWQARRSWLEDYAGCSAVDADRSGKAVLFSTPHAIGGGLHRELRDATGTWHQVVTNNIVTNSGYGTADVPMVGDLVWVRATKEGPTGAGLFFSTDAGASFTKISDALPLYMDFVSAWKGLGTSGAMYATYDGGLTWLKQSDGGGVCCHGDYIWAFDTQSAIWKDGGVGDPNGLADILTYVEPRSPAFELRPGPAVGGTTVDPGSSDVPVLSLVVLNDGPMPLRLSGLQLTAFGSGNDAADVDAVEAWWDRDTDGVLDLDDPLLASGRFVANDGSVVLDLGAKYPVQPTQPFSLLITYDFAGFPTVAGTFGLAVAPLEVQAESTDSGPTLVVAASAPLGTLLTSASFELRANDLMLSGLTLKKAVTAGCLNVSGTVSLSKPAPATGVTVTLADTLASASAPATVTVTAGATTKSFTVRTTPVLALEAGKVSARLGNLTLSQPLSVRPIGVLSVSLSPNPVVGGGVVNAIAKLECKAAPGPIVVALGSSNPALANPSVDHIVVAGGVQSGAFTLGTTPVDVKTKVAVQATANGIQKSKTLTLLVP